jgi:hypothetical protein
VLLKHSGTYVFDHAAQEKVYQDLHAIALANAGRATPTSQPAESAPTVAPAEPPAPVTGKVVAASKKKKK